jgi:4-hydroxy-3-methylbut-2-enyl diphosphate reductase
MEIIIDPKSGFCFGVKKAIEKVETEVDRTGSLYCLGEVVHNSEEVERLAKKGVEFISREAYFKMKNCRVLIRAHGEPPETYRYALQNNIELIDATCPIVFKLQDKIRNARKLNPDAQIVIYGKKEHPEVIGLNAQVEDAIIVEFPEQINLIDLSRPVILFSQTTKDRQKYESIRDAIWQKFTEAGKQKDELIVYNSICGQVADRAPWLAEFSASVDELVFVGGRKSSNSRVLFEVCKKNNAASYFVTNASEVKDLTLELKGRIGVCGATSTPLWLIEEVATELGKKADT